MIELILGGARSGKSRHATQRAAAGALPVTLIATAEGFDAEMRTRIARHRAERDPSWKTVEAPHDLPQQLIVHARAGQCVIVDCLTLWLSNRLLASAPEHGDAAGEAAAAELLAALKRCGGRVILVSNEVGLGLVPDTALGRAFRDAQGRLNQAAAAMAQRVVFIAAGLPLVLKG
ncbi:bifunctional adenosylcobinamide kinase/adenosylcobinamide-phosphate guanylyltransferase [Niveibacterium sp. 24ML]|uniref:bifunctional adenosylcobinamide kinase/adenosylcobinamide-phosphate guanylyltransferase n=1 Tax=Niveibacterium sp. 24ML TaxID=2985512 RepID=UPI003B63B911